MIFKIWVIYSTIISSVFGKQYKGPNWDNKLGKKAGKGVEWIGPNARAGTLPEKIETETTKLKGESGLNGEDGRDGQDGRDGRDGKDGKDGNAIIPLLTNKNKSYKKIVFIFIKMKLSLLFKMERMEF